MSENKMIVEPVTINVCDFPLVADHCGQTLKRIIVVDERINRLWDSEFQTAIDYSNKKGIKAFVLHKGDFHALYNIVMGRVEAV